MKKDTGREREAGDSQVEGGPGLGGMISLHRWGGELENPSAFLRLDEELVAASRNLPVECRGPLNLCVGGTVSADVSVCVCVCMCVLVVG